METASSALSHSFPEKQHYSQRKLIKSQQCENMLINENLSGAVRQFLPV